MKTLTQIFKFDEHEKEMTLKTKLKEKNLYGENESQVINSNGGRLNLFDYIYPFHDKLLILVSKSTLINGAVFS